MKRVSMWSLTVLAVTLGSSIAYAGGEGRPIAGVEMGAVKPVDAYDRFSGAGGILSPYVGFMANDNVGLWGHIHVWGTPEDNGANRRGITDDDATWALGGTVGPRLALPIGHAELWGTGEAGIYTGLAPHSSITDTSFGYTTGGGINAHVTEQFSIGTWARWNHLFQRSHGAGEVRFISAGISLNFDFKEPPPPAPVAAAPLAQAPPPPPPPAPPLKKKIVLRGVNFDFNKSNIRSDARPVLDEAAQTLREESGISVVAEGHTDSVGSDAYNEKLSIRRSQSVKSYLEKMGVSGSRIQSEGHGESKPVASNDTDDGRAQNRRVELRVVD